MLRLLILLNIVLMTYGDYTSNCPQACKCGWANGNKQADCSHAELQEIPQTLSADIQNLDLSENNLNEITQYAFQMAGLINLKKLVLKNCKLTTIHKNGFHSLSIVIQLDLSQNDLSILHSDTFKETVRIRGILLNDNKLEKLEDGLFNNLLFLQKVDLSNNRIVTLGTKTFMKVPKLSILRLDGNKLKTLNIDTLRGLTSLSDLDIHDNPWRCDCYLQPLRDWIIRNHFSNSPISCTEPSDVQGKLWSKLDSSSFVCQPSTIHPTVTTSPSSGSVAP